jgi:hypothetical protein
MKKKGHKMRFCISKVALLICLGFICQTGSSQTTQSTQPSDFDQATIDRAMEKLRERQRARGLTTAPTGEISSRVDRERDQYSDAVVETRRREFLKRCIIEISNAKKILAQNEQDKITKQQHIAELEERKILFQETPTSELREIFQLADVFDVQAEAIRVAIQASNLRCAAEKVAMILLSSGIVDAIVPDPASAEILGPFIEVPCAVEFTTKGGFVRRRIGKIRFNQLGNGIMDPFDIDIDGTVNGRISLLSKFHGGTFPDVHDVQQEYVQDSWSIIVQDGHLAARKIVPQE